jgi:hypothetical protein
VPEEGIVHDDSLTGVAMLGLMPFCGLVFVIFRTGQHRFVVPRLAEKDCTSDLMFEEFDQLELLSP